VNNIPSNECDPLPVQIFEEHLIHLKFNYDVISIDALVHGLYGGGPLPNRPVAITFDDGYVDNYTQAFPLLLKYQLPATIYLATDFISGKLQLIHAEGWNSMSWEQVREMQQSGFISFAAHTRTHPILRSLSDEQVSEEIEGSREDIRRQLGIEVKTFAYPNGQGGDISRQSIQTVKESGFEAAFSTLWSTRHKPNDQWLISRVMISGRDDMAVLEHKLQGNYDYLFYWHKIRALVACLSGCNGVWR
jgi:peptidoglycan/xylan/chitin deacetylase (PgdA/CDA1 family)